METQEAIENLKKDKSPELKVLAKFDTEMQFQLRPEIFRLLTKIADLLKSKLNTEEYYIKKKLKRIDKAEYHSEASHL